jgi:hypothetical protein
MYQRGSDTTFSYGFKLNKKAPTGLVDEVQLFCRKVVSKTKNWYLAESRNLEVDVAWRKLDGFLDTVCHEAGLDPSGQMPLTGNGIDWNKFSELGDDGVE